MKTIGILGSGTWGTALAMAAAREGHQVTLWSPFSSELEALQATHTHPNLPDSTIPDTVIFEASLERACADKHLIVFAVPSVYLRSTAILAKPYLTKGQVLVDVAKGLEESTLYTMTQVIGDVLGAGYAIVALSGPTHAEEVARGIPTAIVAASHDQSAAKLVQDIFMSPVFRVYLNEDIVGVELSGALKNIVALAAGISQGLGYGDNTIAAMITRGIAEIARLGTVMGCHTETFYGLAGLGDLVVTCYSHHSRNHKAGKLIGEGCSLEEAIRQVGMVVEGVNALPAALKLSQKYHVELPIIEAVDAVLTGKLAPKEAVYLLMTREKKAE